LRQDGLRQDGLRQDGLRQDGLRQDGLRQDGVRSVSRGNVAFSPRCLLGQGDLSLGTRFFEPRFPFGRVEVGYDLLMFLIRRFARFFVTTHHRHELSPFLCAFRSRSM
jgi:hypothetical protein